MTASVRIELLEAKTHRPLPRHAFRRPLLEERVRELASQDLLLVCGPAGSGKSTLLSSAFAELAKADSLVWYNLDENDLFQDAKTYIDQALSSASHKAAALVIENLHALTAADQSSLLAFLRTVQSEFLAVAVSTRYITPGVHESSFNIIGPDMLRSDSCEIAQYLHLRFPQAQPEAFEMLAEAITLASGGWAIAVSSLADAYENADSSSDLEAVTDCAHMLKRYREEVSPYCCNIPFLDVQIAIDIFGSQTLNPADLKASAPATPVSPVERLQENPGAKVQLSAKEEQVLRMLVDGKKPKQIAADTFTSEATVRTHIKHIYKKLGAHGKKDALEKAILLGVI